jgi:uncharacterized protein YpmB
LLPWECHLPIYEENANGDKESRNNQEKVDFEAQAGEEIKRLTSEPK